jgi:hypothetical protein
MTCQRGLLRVWIFPLLLGRLVINIYIDVLQKIAFSLLISTKNSFLKRTSEFGFAIKQR